MFCSFFFLSDCLIDYFFVYLLVSLFFMFISLINSLSNRFFLFYSDDSSLLFKKFYICLISLLDCFCFFFFLVCFCEFLFHYWFDLFVIFFFDFFRLFVCLFLFEYLFLLMVESLFHCLFDWLQFLSSKCLVCFVLFVSFSLTLFESLFHCLFVWSIAVSVFEFDMFCSLLIFHSHCVEYRCLYGKKHFPPFYWSLFQSRSYNCTSIVLCRIKKRTNAQWWRASQWLCSPPKWEGRLAI